MKILHVSLGNPETHQGGLNRYCKDLMRSQILLGHQVHILYPGCFGGRKLKIKEASEGCHEIINALPVALNYGIDHPEKYVQKGDLLYYKKWLQGFGPDIIHVHSIQGIHLEFFEAANQLGIKMVFTTHDYYPFCPKCVLYDRDGKLCSGFDAVKCSACNQGCGLSSTKQRLIQSALYQKIKNNKVIRKLRSALSNRLKESFATTSQSLVPTSKIVAFEALKKYYKDILNCFDVIHCNSQLSFEKYSAILDPKKCKVVTITHEGLKKSTHTKKNSYFGIGYLGGPNVYKGYKKLEEALDLLEASEITNWKAYFYGGKFNQTVEGKTNREYYDYFSALEADAVWESVDILVAPGQWYETYGFVILEALCRGIPVVSTELYGSGYLLKDLDERLIFRHDSARHLADSLAWLMNQENYSRIAQAIGKMPLTIDMKKHALELEELYKREVCNDH